MADVDVQQVELLLQATLATKKVFEDFQKSTADSQEFENLDRSIKTLSIKSKKLSENVDSLLARVEQCDERLGILKVEHTQNTQTDTEKGTIDLVRAEELLARLQTTLTISNNPSMIAKMQKPPITLSITGFKERKKNDNVLYTDPFYSHPSGYKMCLNFYFNGCNDAKGTHVSVYWILLPGEFDEILEWPFAGCLVLQLLNQRKDRLHHTETLTMCNDASLKNRERPNPKECKPEDRPAWGKSMFISHDDLPAKGFFADKEYLKNDTLMFRVYKVEIYNLRY